MKRVLILAVISCVFALIGVYFTFIHDTYSESYMFKLAYIVQCITSFVLLYDNENSKIK